MYQKKAKIVPSVGWNESRGPGTWRESERRGNLAMRSTKGGSIFNQSEMTNPKNA